MFQSNCYALLLKGIGGTFSYSTDVQQVSRSVEFPMAGLCSYRRWYFDNGRFIIAGFILFGVVLSRHMEVRAKRPFGSCYHVYERSSAGGCVVGTSSRTFNISCRLKTVCKPCARPSASSVLGYFTRAPEIRNGGIGTVDVRPVGHRETGEYFYYYISTFLFRYRFTAV